MYTSIYIALVVVGTFVILPLTVFLIKRMIKGFEENINILFGKLDGLPCQNHGERIARMEGAMQLKLRRSTDYDMQEKQL